jgi:hypothetical protein
MNPALALSDAVNLRAAHAELAAESPIAGGRCPDGGGVLSRELCAAVPTAPKLCAVPLTVGQIFCRCRPAEVVKAVVLSVAIVVRDLMLTGRSLSQKSHCHQSVNTQPLSLPAREKPHTPVSRVFQILLAKHRARALPAKNPPDAPVRADLVFWRAWDFPPLLVNIGHGDILRPLCSQGNCDVATAL